MQISLTNLRKRKYHMMKGTVFLKCMVFNLFKFQQWVQLIFHKLLIFWPEKYLKDLMQQESTPLKYLKHNFKLKSKIPMVIVAAIDIKTTLSFFNYQSLSFLSDKSKWVKTLKAIKFYLINLIFIIYLSFYYIEKYKYAKSP